MSRIFFLFLFLFGFFSKISMLKSCSVRPINSNSLRQNPSGIKSAYSSHRSWRKEISSMAGHGRYS